MTEMDHSDINDKIDNIMHIFERMMELQCEIHYEKIYCNYKTVSRLKKEQYNPLNQELREQLESLFSGLGRPPV